jgi:hypothetical protein
MTGKSRKAIRYNLAGKMYIMIKTANVDLFIYKYLQIFRLTFQEHRFFPLQVNFERIKEIIL